VCHGEPLRARGRKDMQPVLRRQPQPSQTGANLQDLGKVLLVCDVGVFGQLVVGPFLLDLGGLAVNDLRDLLLLPVRVNQLPAPDGRFVAVELGTPF